MTTALRNQAGYVRNVIADEFDVLMDDGVLVHAYVWLPADRPRAIVQIAHGMAEHCVRYGRFASMLVEHGYAVLGHDHRGHGLTAAREEDLGHFADEAGFDRLVVDLLAIRREIPRVIADVGELKVGLFAHSMGSFITQRALTLQPPSSWDAVILAGSDAPTGKGVSALRRVAACERLRQGKRGRSGVIDSLAFGPYNRTFKPTRTQSDWLSRDAVEVDRFLEDPLTGFRLTNQSWVDFLDARIRVGRQGFDAVSPKALPILLMAGDRDPVGRLGAGVRQLQHELRAAGLSNVETTLYPGARHELLNEVNRDEVFTDVLAFLDRM